MANNMDPNEMAQKSHLIWIYFVCRGLTRVSTSENGGKRFWRKQLIQFGGVPLTEHHTSELN